METTLDRSDVNRLLDAHHSDPFAVLGMHSLDGQVAVRVFRPDAKSVSVLDASAPGSAWMADRVADDGFFEAVIDRDAPFDYRLRIEPWVGGVFETADPYSFGQILGATDVYLHAEGNHYDVYEKLGAHLTEIGGVAGCSFAVWAPNAQRVSVVGDFNRWDGRVHAMRKLLGSGIWEIFIPGVGVGAHYKFEIKAIDGALHMKSDPYAFFSQNGLQTASMVYDIHRYTWSDQAWMDERRSKEWHRAPMSIYEAHLGSWARVPEDGNRYLSYREMAERLVPYVRECGFTHVELMPVAEHPFDGSWGYQVTGYFAPTSRFGSPDDFRHLVDCFHQAGIGVIVDWVPGHFPKDAHGLARFDGTHLYEHADPRQGEHRDWGTLIFNHGRNEVRNFLIANALFWLKEYHIDGLRVDAVASMLYLDYSRTDGDWVPNCHGGRENLDAIHFIKRANEICYERHPGIVTIAEESTAWPAVSRPTYIGGLGFGFKWNMGWMNDSLSYIAKDPVHRRYHQGDITFALLYAFTEHFILVISHDEVVHGKGSMYGKMPGDRWQKFANLRMFYAWMWAHPGKKLIFQGCEIGQTSEWNHDASLDWHLLDHPEHDGLRRLIQHLNHLYVNEPSFWSLDDTYDGFEWIDFHDADNSVVSFARYGAHGEAMVFIVNATPVVRHGYRVGLPGGGFYEEVLNTDAETYGGSNVGNLGGRPAEATPWQGMDSSAEFTLPPLSVLGFRRIDDRGDVGDAPSGDSVAGDVADGSDAAPRAGGFRL